MAIVVKPREAGRLAAFGILELVQLPGFELIACEARGRPMTRLPPWDRRLVS